MIWENGEGVLLFVPADMGGTIYLISKTDVQVEYFVKLETMSRKLTGQTVTQVALWRSISAGRIYRDVARTVFFQFVLPRYGTMMSDEQQTRDGRRFWQTMMVEAAAKGYTVSFVDFRGSKVETFVPGTDNIVGWISAQNAWGKGDVFEDRRFLIATQPSMT